MYTLEEDFETAPIPQVTAPLHLQEKTQIIPVVTITEPLQTYNPSERFLIGMAVLMLLGSLFMLVDMYLFWVLRP